MTAPTLDSRSRLGSASGVISETNREGWRLSGACGASVLLHAVVFGLIAGLGWAVKEAVEPLAFEMVPYAGTQGKMLDEAGPSADRPGQTGVPAGPERLFTAPPSVRSWTPPKWRETAEAAAAIAHRPMPADPGPSRPAARRMTYPEYVRQAGGTAPGNAASAASRNRGTSTAAPRISVPAAGPGTGDGGSAPGNAQGDKMASYFADLVRQLGERHEKPAGLSDLLSAEVGFTLSADGRISDLHIVRSSGNAGFDRSVREAFARVRLPGRPDGKTDARTLTFRMQEA